jgi:hypothetical protein
MAVRRTVNATYTTLDGDITNVKDWHWDHFGDEARKSADDHLFGSDAIIMAAPPTTASSRCGRTGRAPASTRTG